MEGLLFFYLCFTRPLQRPREAWFGYAHDVVCLAYSELFVLSMNQDAP